MKLSAHPAETRRASTRGDRVAAAALPAAAGVSLAVILATLDQAQAQVIEIGPWGSRTVSGSAALSGGSTIVASQGPIAVPASTQAPSPKTLERRRRVIADLEAAGQTAQLSPKLIEAVAWAESRFDAAARSDKGAIGVMQLKPETAAEMGVNPEHVEENIRGGAKYLRQMLARFHGNVELALAAYNSGPAAVERYGGIPPFPETRAYVAAVLDYLADISVEAPR